MTDSEFNQSVQAARRDFARLCEYVEIASVVGGGTWGIASLQEEERGWSHQRDGGTCRWDARRGPGRGSPRTSNR